MYCELIGSLCCPSVFDSIAANFNYKVVCAFLPVLMAKKIEFELVNGSPLE